MEEIAVARAAARWPGRRTSGVRSHAEGAEAAIDKILTTDQRRRVREIAIQLAGNHAVLGSKSPE